MKNEDKNIQNNNELEFEIEDISFDDATVNMDINVDRKIDIQESISDDTPTFDNQPNQEIQSDMEDVSESNSGVNEENSISNVSDVPEEIDSSNDMVDTSDENEHAALDKNSDDIQESDSLNEKIPKEQMLDNTDDEGKTDGNSEETNKKDGDEVSNENKSDSSSEDKSQNDKSAISSEDKTEDNKPPVNNQEKNNVQNENNQPQSKEPSTEKKENPSDNKQEPEQKSDAPKNDEQNSSNNAPAKKEENIPKSSADKKRDEAKQKQENRNRNNKQNKNNVQKGAGGIKDRAKNAAKNYAQQKANQNAAVQKAKQAQQKVQQAKKKVQQVKKAVAATKAAISTISTIIGAIAAIGLPGIIIIVVVILLCALLAIFTPSFAENTDTSGLSSTDQKTQEKLNDIYSKYPNASKSLGTISVVYPYFSELWGADTSMCLGTTSDTSSDVEYSEEEADTAEDDTEDITSEDAVQDDEYLKFFQKWKYRKRLKKFMKKLEGTTDDDYLNYMETDIFDKNGYGYDDMFEKSTCSTEDLSSYIKKDLKGLKNSFSTTTFSSLNRDADRNKIREFVDTYVGDPASGGEKIPYYEGGLADNAGYSGNNFNTDVTADSAGRTKKGLGSAGFVNWVYWSVVSENFGNQNSIDNIIAKSYEITLSDLKNGDMGYDDSKTVIAIYNDGKWVYEDAATGYVVSDTGGGKFTKYIRANYFQNEMYNFTVRTTAPTPEEWNTDRIPIFKWPSTDSLIGECVFYVKNRALEIIQELYNNGSLNDVQYKTYKDRIWNYSGNADEFWYKNSSGNPGIVWNGYSDNSRSAVITDVRPGAILGATSTSAQGAIYGHVLVVEYANPDEDKIIVTDMSNGTRTDCTKTDFKCITQFNSRTYTYEEFYNKYKEGSKTSFRGYLFFLYNN